ncbi:MAG TPA: hypothetical protein ENH87_02015 [Pricia antarctica]|uniref:Uncharacterized protein n=3 Tax=root TaxID=1 RepID=A0A831QML3_9FLAO|nr:hypothetical protein [Pricia antarctica]
MTRSNGKGVKIAGGITFGTLVLAITLYFTLTDRAKESGVAKATVKMQVEAVEKRVDHLETHASETENVLNGKDGVVATVEVIKSKIENIEKQGVDLKEQNRLILQKIDALPKK